MEPKVWIVHSPCSSASLFRSLPLSLILVHVLVYFFRPASSKESMCLLQNHFGDISAESADPFPGSSPIASNSDCSSSLSSLTPWNALPEGRETGIVSRGIFGHDPISNINMGLLRFMPIWFCLSSTYMILPTNVSGFMVGTGYLTKTHCSIGHSCVGDLPFLHVFVKNLQALIQGMGNERCAFAILVAFLVFRHLRLRTRTIILWVRTAVLRSGSQNRMDGAGWSSIAGSNEQMRTLKEKKRRRRKRRDSKGAPSKGDGHVVIDVADKVDCTDSPRTVLPSSARAPGPKKRVEDEYIYDIWGDHFLELHLFSRQREEESAQLTFDVEDKNNSFFSRGPRSLTS